MLKELKPIQGMEGLHVVRNYHAIVKAVCENQHLIFFMNTWRDIRLYRVTVPSNTPGFGRIVLMNVKEKELAPSMRFKYVIHRFTGPTIEWLYTNDE